MKVFRRFLLGAVLTTAAFCQMTLAASATRSFNEVSIQGYVNVLIRQGAPAVTVSGDLSKQLLTHVSHHKLYVEAPWQPTIGVVKRPLVTVTLPNLNKLFIDGPANVGGENIRSKHLAIESHGSGKIKLIGVMNLTQIDQTGSNRIYLRWVNSDTLTINAKDRGFIYLGGVAKTLYARVTQQAIFNAQYLRTDIVQVQTKHFAAAFVYPVTTLRAFASEHSNIYYYKYPKYLTRETTQSGNVLQMAWRS